MSSGMETVERLAGKDLTGDGIVINLAIVCSSTFYDYSVVEDHLDTWVEENGWPDLIILGGASGVDYLAERWADNNNIEAAIFHEAWRANRPGLKDSGRIEARENLVDDILNRATHLVAFPESHSKWTRITINKALEAGMKTSILELE